MKRESFGNTAWTSSFSMSVAGVARRKLSNRVKCPSASSPEARSLILISPAAIWWLLANLAKMSLSFPTSSLGTTRSYIGRNENTVRKFVRGYVEGVHFAKTQRAFGVQVMKKYLRNDDTAFVNDLYDLYVLQNIPQIPRPSPEALKTIMDQMAETDPRVANLRPEQFIDARFFQELEKEGFIQRLWK